jgi:hypothetical protein
VCFIEVGRFHIIQNKNAQAKSSHHIAHFPESAIAERTGAIKAYGLIITGDNNVFLATFLITPGASGEGEINF